MRRRSMVNVTHTFRSPWQVTGQLLKGKSLIRALFNLSLKNIQIGGDVLDLGSKDGAASYYKFLRLAPGTKLTLSDMNPSDTVTAVNVEAPLPFPDESFDTVLAFHLFEHVYRLDVAPPQIFRILRPGGRLLVSIPFLHEYHGDPDDYFRLTSSAMVRLGEDAGLRCEYIEAIGEGVVTLSLTKLPHLIAPRVARPLLTALLYLFAFPIDRLIALRPAVNGKTVPSRFALEHFAIFEKPKRP